MVGLLDFLKSPQAQGLAVGLLNSSGYSTTPISFGQALGQGMEKSNEYGQRDLLNKVQREKLDLNKVYTDAQIKNLEQDQLYKNRSLGLQERGLGLEAGRMGLESKKLEMLIQQAQREAAMNEEVNNLIRSSLAQPQPQQPAAVANDDLKMSVMPVSGAAQNQQFAPSQSVGNNLMAIAAMKRNPALSAFGQTLIKQEQASPEFRARVKQAEKLGTERGVDMQTLESMESKLPELLKTTEKLKGLANEATYTLGGKATDALVKQFGGQSQGSLAASNYENTVSNIILPMLKDTFGAAFTVEEGARLEKTLGNASMTPAEKQSAIDNFVNEQISKVNGLRRRFGKEPITPPSTATGSNQQDPLGLGI